MKQPPAFLPILFTIVLLCVAGCTKDTGDPDDDFFLPNFSNQWTCTNNRNPGSQFVFNASAQNDTTGTGILSGFESNNGSTYNYTGSYKYESIQVHYLSKAESNNFDNGPDAGLTFSGKLDTTHSLLVMRLVNTANKSDSLVLQQHN